MATKNSVAEFIIDFAKEESGGGGGIRIKEGTYLVKVIAAKPIKSTEKGTPGLELKLKILGGGSKQAKGKTLTETLWATPKAYSRFRTLLEAAGKKVPSKVNLVKIAAAVKGVEMYVEVADDEREGYKTRSRVSYEGFIHPDNLDTDEDDDDSEDDDDDDLDDDDEDLDDDEDDEDDEDEDTDLDELDRAELKAYIKENALEVTVKRSMDDDDLREAIKAAEADDDDEDEDDEDEEDEPPVKKSRKKAPAKKRKKADDDDDDDLDLDSL